MEENKSARERVIKMFPKQFDAFNFTTQFCTICAGVQSGKTFTGSLWAGKKMLEYPKGVGIIAAPTYKILQHATTKKLFEMFPELRAGYKEQKGEIELPTGGVIYVRSMDNPFGAEGITANWWWFDEGGQASVNAWTVLRSRVSMTGGQGLITTTPYNMGWLYLDFFKRIGIDKNLSFYSWKSIENPYFPVDYYNAERLRLRPEEFARRYEGEFKKMSGLVWDIPDEQIIDEREIMTKADARIMGVDWGWENPAAIVILYLYGTTNIKSWYVVDEWKQSHRTTAEIIQVMKNKMVEKKITQIFADPAEPDRIQECRNANLPMMETNKDVKGGISNIQQLIREKRFWVFNRCKEFIEEASMYHYPEPEEGKEIKDLPEPINNHLCDALRYAAYSYRPVNLLQPQASQPILPYYIDLGI